jgi:hypothetical protein
MHSEPLKSQTQRGSEETDRRRTSWHAGLRGRQARPAQLAGQVIRPRTVLAIARHAFSGGGRASPEKIKAGTAVLGSLILPNGVAADRTGGPTSFGSFRQQASDRRDPGHARGTGSSVRYRRGSQVHPQRVWVRPRTVLRLRPRPRRNRARKRPALDHASGRSRRRGRGDGRSIESESPRARSLRSHPVPRNAGWADTRPVGETGRAATGSRTACTREPCGRRL